MTTELLDMPTDTLPAPAYKILPIGDDPDELCVVLLVAYSDWLIPVELGVENTNVDPPAEVLMPTDKIPYPAIVRLRASTVMPLVLPAVFDVAANDND